MLLQVGNLTPYYTVGQGGLRLRGVYGTRFFSGGPAGARWSARFGCLALLRVWRAGHPLADGDYELVDAGVRLAEAAISLAVAGGGFLGEFGDTGSRAVQAICDGGDFDGEVVELALCVAPEGAELLAVFAALGKPGGCVLDAFEALFDRPCPSPTALHSESRRMSSRASATGTERLT